MSAATSAAVTTWQGEQLWAATASTGPDWRLPRHGTTDALDGRALCGAWVYAFEGRVGETIAHPYWFQDNYDGSPPEHRVTCKRCLKKLAASVV